MDSMAQGADAEGTMKVIKKTLEYGGCERDVIDGIGSALSSAKKLSNNGKWNSFYKEEIQNGGATTLPPSPQQRSLGDHLKEVRVTADKNDGKSDASSLTGSPKTGKPKASSEKSVGDDSAKSAPADATTLSATGATNGAFDSEEAGGDAADEGATTGQVTGTIRRTDELSSQPTPGTRGREHRRAV